MAKITNWQINGPLQVIRQRAFLLSEIRAFFSTKEVLEVETPVLSSAANTDLQIEVFKTQGIVQNQSAAYLRTSPEFFHKRLLASGSGDIFELARVFRMDESTALHNPEFTLLEWYRLDYTMYQLMDEVVELIHILRLAFGLKSMKTVQITYQSLYQKYLKFDPFNVDLDQLNQLAKEAGYHGSELSKTQALDFMFGVKIAPLLEPNSGYLIHDFPIEQAALAQAHPEHPDRCLRFEFLWGGMELANGYQELTDAQEQLSRFEQDNLNRQLAGKVKLPIDGRLIGAMEAGLPACSGVALGIERLLMCLLECQTINEVMPFTADNS